MYLLLEYSTDINLTVTMRYVRSSKTTAKSLPSTITVSISPIRLQDVLIL